MPTTWTLEVRKNMVTIDYNDRLFVAKKLEATIAKARLRHLSYRDAAAAAVAISKSPLVVFVAVKRVTEEIEGVWRNGSKS